MRRIVVPPAPGLFSSFGLLFADVEHHYVRTWRRLVRRVQTAELGDVLGRMESEARAQLAAEGFRGDAARLRRSADCRYEGQSFELTVPVADGPVEAWTVTGIEEAFGREHQRTYGHRAGDDEPVEIVSLRVVGLGIPVRPRVPDALRVDRAGPGRAVAPEARLCATRRVYFGPDLGWRETPIIDRPDLATPRAGGSVGGVSPPGLLGPAIVEEYDATCLIPPGARGSLDAHGNIVIELPRDGEEV
jgi:N-methylhydantoinase A